MLVSSLLEKNANCNLLTLPLFIHNASTLNDDGTVTKHCTEEIYNQTPLHLAILGKHEAIIKEILSYHDRASRKGLLDSVLLTPDLNLKNSKHQTSLSLAIEMKLMEIAEMLISAGADVDVRDENGYTLLHLSIMAGDCDSAHFLLMHGADFTLKCHSGNTYLQYAVRHKLANVVKELCSLGCDVNVCTGDSRGDCVLWEALRLDCTEIASILVQYKCDTDLWHATEEGFTQTLLHRALDENNQVTAVFLIRSGCDIHCVRKPGSNGDGAEYCDQQTPVHFSFLINLQVN